MNVDLIWSAIKVELTKLSDSVNLLLVLRIRHSAMPIKLAPKSMESNSAPTKHAHLILNAPILTIAPTLELQQETALSVPLENVNQVSCAPKQLVESATTLFVLRLTHALQFRPVLLILKVKISVPISSAHQQVIVPTPTTAHLLLLEHKFARCVKEVIAAQVKLVISLLILQLMVNVNLLLTATLQTHVLLSKLAQMSLQKMSALMLTVQMILIAVLLQTTARLEPLVRKYAHTAILVTINVAQVTSANLRQLYQPKDSVLLQKLLALLINNKIAMRTKLALLLETHTNVKTFLAQQTMDVHTPTTALTQLQTESVLLVHQTQIVDPEHVTRPLALPLKVFAQLLLALQVELSAILLLTTAPLPLQETKFALTV